VAHAPSRSLVALADHIELRESGWWEKAQRESIVNGLFQRQPAVEPDDLLRQVLAELHLGIDAIDGLTSSLSALVNDGLVIRLDDGRVKLAETEIERFASELSAYQSRVESVERHFYDLVRELAPHLDGLATFRLFESEFLLPYISEFGAATWRALVRGDLSSATQSPSLALFLSHYDPANHQALLDVAIRFLDATHADTRRYVLQLLSAYFFTQSAVVDIRGFDFETLYKELLTRPLVLIPDSDILVSMLAQVPTGIVADFTEAFAMGRPPVEALVAADFTAKAIQRELRNLAFALSEEGAVVFTSAQQRRNSAWLSAVPDDARGRQAWLERSAREIEALVRARYIVYERNPSRDELLSNDEIRLECERGISLAGTGLEKSPTEWLHDLLLRHFVYRLRGMTGRLLEATFWLLTEDPELIAYDRNFVAERGGLPACMHPIAALQLSRFTERPDHHRWEQVFLALLRQPAILARLSGNAEATAMRLLDATDWWSALGEGGEYALEQRIESMLVNERLLAVGPLQQQVARAQERLRVRLEQSQLDVSRARERVQATLPADAPARLRELVDQIFIDLSHSVVTLAGGGQTTVSSINAEQVNFILLPPADRDALQQLVDVSRTISAGGKVEPAIVGEIRSAADKIDRELKSEIQDRGVIRRALSVLNAIAEGAAGSAVYAGLLEVIARLHHLM
jgi:hypothetical protein